MDEFPSSIAKSALPQETVLRAPALAPDCWKTHGIHGDGTCPELAQVVHCRNCQVYSAAAVRLLSGPLPTGYREEWSRRLAVTRTPRELCSGSVILFQVETEWLALPTRCFQEVTDRRPIHSLPYQPPFLLGLANVRGELICCISLAHFLGLGHVPNRNSLKTNYSRLLVLSWNGSRLCFPASAVEGPRKFSQADLRPATARLSRDSSGLTSCVLHCEQKMVGVLDANLLCSALARGLK